MCAIRVIGIALYSLTNEDHQQLAIDVIHN